MENNESKTLLDTMIKNLQKTYDNTDTELARREFEQYIEYLEALKYVEYDLTTSMHLESLILFMQVALMSCGISLDSVKKLNPMLRLMALVCKYCPVPVPETIIDTLFTQLDMSKFQADNYPHEDIEAIQNTRNNLKALKESFQDELLRLNIPAIRQNATISALGNTLISTMHSTMIGARSEESTERLAQILIGLAYSLGRKHTCELN